ncbi:hypothetical protein CCHR01_04983 [Colletotrichum chrysophilum]|uniref:Secreted protein n=1 Tax=Colletotrichum chrysophilum TaxID=1836956 RepID=A0AAD9EM05_9PEZI|nr:hypothetical protein CCHR01_04983 [Colletotrichum chrysophilum]
MRSRPRSSLLLLVNLVSTPKARARARGVSKDYTLFFSWRLFDIRCTSIVCVLFPITHTTEMASTSGQTSRRLCTPGPRFYGLAIPDSLRLCEALLCRDRRRPRGTRELAGLRRAWFNVAGVAPCSTLTMLAELPLPH